MDAVTNLNGYCDQLEWTLWPMRNIAVTNWNKCHDQSEWIPWPIKMDMMTKQNGLCNQSEGKLSHQRYTSPNSCCGCTSVCSWIWAWTVGQCGCAKLVNAGSAEMCSGQAGSPPTTVHIPSTGGGLEVHFLKWDMGMPRIFRRLVALTSLVT